MLWGLSGGASYKGSNLERLIKARAAQTVDLNEENIGLFGRALLSEYPRPFEHLARINNKPPPQLDDKQKELAEAITARGLAIQGLTLIASSAVLAEAYGNDIDNVKSSNDALAIAVAYGLIEYANACNVPFKSTEGGYRRYLSGYLILRNSMQSLGVLEPWEKYLAAQEINGSSLASSINDQSTHNLLKFAPQSEQPVI